MTRTIYSLPLIYKIILYLIPISISIPIPISKIYFSAYKHLIDNINSIS